MAPRGRQVAPPLLVLAFLAGCGRVAGNYPGQQAPLAERNPFEDSRLTCSYGGVHVWVGDRIDTAAARARQASVHDPMRQAMGEAAFARLRAESARRYPWTTRITADDSHTYYRASVMTERVDRFTLQEGALVFESVTNGRLVTARDQGLLFRFGDEEAAWPFSGDRTIDSRRDLAGLRTGDVVLVTIRLPRRLEMVAVRLDTTRIRVVRAE